MLSTIFAKVYVFAKFSIFSKAPNDKKKKYSGAVPLVDSYSFLK